MNTKIFAGGVLFVATVGAFVGGVDLGRMSRTSFDFASASEEDRTAFLKSQADTMGRQLKRGLISPSGVGPTLHLGNVEVSPRVPEITYVINVNGPAKVSDQFDVIEHKMLLSACPAYLSSELGKNGVRIVLSFAMNKREAARIVVSNTGCQKIA